MRAPARRHAHYTPTFFATRPRPPPMTPTPPHDLVRCTVQVEDVRGVVAVLELVLKSKDFVVVRIKNRFAKSYNSRPIGGYRDLQLMMLFRNAEGGWCLAELQINVAGFVRLKGRKGGGHGSGAGRARMDGADAPACSADLRRVRDRPTERRSRCLRAPASLLCVGCRCDVQCGAMRVDALGAVPPVQSW